MTDLITRLSALDGPDREVDAGIVVALDLRPEWLAGSDGKMWVDVEPFGVTVRWSHNKRKSAGDPPAYRTDQHPRYTESVDAALTLPDAENHVHEAAAMVEYHGWARGKFGEEMARCLCRLVIEARHDA